MTDADLIRCPACSALNRVPADKLARGLRPVCGRCKTALGAGTAPIAVSDATFSDVVEGSTLPVLVDAWAAWCGPCRIIAPIIDELAREWAGRVLVTKLNVDENPRTAARFNLRSIPTLLLMRGGREIDRIVGAHPKPAIVEHLRRLAP